ncbi:uncharacterized protein M6D78_012629 [Vipera latastei]
MECVVTNANLGEQEQYAGQQMVNVTFLISALANLLSVPQISSKGMDIHAKTTMVTATMGHAPSWESNVFLSLGQVQLWLKIHVFSLIVGAIIMATAERKIIQKLHVHQKM